MSPAAAYRICFVCSGNICRSPMGEVVLAAMAADAGLAGALDVDSAGTGDWHIGERADRRTIAALAARGYDGSGHRAQQFDPHWFPRRDLVVALDRGHERTLRSWAPTPEDRAKVRLLRAFDPGRRSGVDLDIPDPYYGDDRTFDEVLEQVESSCRALLTHVRRQLAERGRP